MDEMEKSPMNQETPQFQDSPQIQETPQKTDRTGFAIASLVLGILSVVLFCIWFISIPLSILGVIFGALSLKSSSRGMAIAGLVLSIIALALALAIVILVIIGAVSDSLSRTTDYRFT